MSARTGSARGGYAMLVVLLTLMALFVLCAPFLLTVRNADQATHQSADRAAADLALGSAERLARARLSASHPGVDRTSDYDSADELAVSNRFPDGFLDANDPNGVMFDLAARDVSARIDLNSAPPACFANLIGGVAVTVEPIAPDAQSVKLSTTAGFLPAGFVWLQGELLSYASIEGGALQGLQRGLAVKTGEDGRPLECGPKPAQAVKAGAIVLDQRAHALALWRALGPGGTLRGFDAPEQVRAAEELVLADGLGAAAVDALVRAGTVHAGVGAGAAWQRPTRVTNELQAGESCQIRVEDGRWFNAGTTVLLTDGRNAEIGIVLDAANGGVVLHDPVHASYAAFSATLSPLARRPVNVNTADEEVLYALILNLQLRGRQARISSSEARSLVAAIVASRPFTSFEDFVRRLVLPAGGFEPLPADAPVVPEAFRPSEDEAAPMCDEDDARALYKNALNANDAELAFSTMPFAFTSTDVHALDLRAAVNAASGLERVHAAREEVRLCVPQRDLMFLATRQEDFERLFRLDRDAAGWATGPWNTSRFDPAFRSSPPTRARAHLDAYDTQPPGDALGGETQPVFAARDEQDEDGFAMPWAARLEDTGLVAGRALHFDDEPRGLEGRDLKDGRVALDADDARVRWSSGGLMRPFSFALWIRPRALAEGALYLDCAGAFSDADRASLLIEGGDLVLRVLDGSGDHPDTAFEERGEARYPLAAGEGPGMPLDTWIHVAGDVHGNRPDQITLVVDGRMDATTPGLTRLSAALGDQDSVIAVESTEGFPDVCVLRIGRELIEAVKSGPSTFTATYASTGASAGFGGRLARVEFQGADPGLPIAAEFAASTGQYASGTPVELYGYSLQLQSNVPSGGGSLASALGAFAIGRVVPGEEMEEITVVTQYGEVTVGRGLETQAQAGIKLVPADPGVTLEELMSAFDPQGGYAVLASVRASFRLGPPGQPAAQVGTTTEGLVFGGLEVVRYSGWSGDTLHVVQRGDAVQLPDLKTGGGDEASSYDTKKAFVFEWGPITLADTGQPVAEILTWNTKVFPISVRVSGAGALDLLASGESNSSLNPRVAQITRLGAESGFTEWVRYDYNTGTDLVRDDPQVLEDVLYAVQTGAIDATGEGTTPPPGGGGGTGTPGQPGGGGGSSGFGGGGPPAPPPAFLAAPPPALAPPAPPPPSAPATALDGASWHPRIGEDEHEDHPIARSVASVLQHRGVLGTFDHAHPAGTAVLPVWKVVDEGVDAGRPGRFDAVMLLDASPTQPGFPGVVHRAHRPTTYTEYSWALSSDPMVPQAIAGGTTDAHPKELADFTLVALEEPLTAPFAPSSPGTGASGTPISDARLLARVAKFPSGELPRAVASVAVGGAATALASVPDAVIDEVVFGDARFGQSSGAPGGELVLEAAIGPNDNALEVEPHALRTALGLHGVPGPPLLAQWPEDAGLVRIGDEILCYQAYDAESGTLAIAPGGRGLLGTDPGPHAVGEEVLLLEPFPVTVLAGGVSAEDALLVATSLEEFPSAGLVRVGDELVHYTRLDGPALGMPAASSEPGRADGRGAGLFRGRFGTQPAGHAAGTPVVLHPFRYWDRWADRADAPELHYLGVRVDQPAALWRNAFFDVEDTGVAGPRLRVLQRTDPAVPWDFDPEESEELAVLTEGMPNGAGNPVARQSDAIEWRVHVRYEPGAFDPALGLSHGWKTAPRLRLFGAEYLAPGLVLRRVER